MRSSLFTRLLLFACLLALVVVVLGAYVRLSNAGLGCPDWPGCYGQIGVPQNSMEIHQANQDFPQRPVEISKAWKEMVHRYFAGILGVVILILAILAWLHRNDRNQQVMIPTVLVGLVIFQAILGMWTVTWLLKPAIVTAHLLGGMTILALLWWLRLRHTQLWKAILATGTSVRALRPLALSGLVVLGIQILLGGWTSANYAALSCPDFPVCQGTWWPPTDFKEAFTLWRGIGLNYEGGLLSNNARVTIHLVHRIGALVTFVVLGYLSIKLIQAKYDYVLRNMGRVLLLVLLLQVSLGIANVLMALPLSIAVAHNAVAVLLLLTLISLNHSLRPRVETI